LLAGQYQVEGCQMGWRHWLRHGSASPIWSWWRPILPWQRMCHPARKSGGKGIAVLKRNLFNNNYLNAWRGT
jgi:hypothetical protein